MTEVPVTLDELLETREERTANVVEKMPMHHRRFLISAKRGEPDWSLLELPGMEALPAVRWKLENLAKLDEAKRTILLERLTRVLGNVD